MAAVLRAFSPEQVRTMMAEGRHMGGWGLWTRAQDTDPGVLATKALADRRMSIWLRRLTFWLGGLGLVIFVASIFSEFLLDNLALVLLLIAVIGVSMFVLDVLVDDLRERYADFSREGFGAQYAHLLNIGGLTLDEAARASEDAIRDRVCAALHAQQQHVMCTAGDNSPVDEYGTTRAAFERSVFDWCLKVCGAFGIKPPSDPALESQVAA